VALIFFGPISQPSAPYFSLQQDSNEYFLRKERGYGDSLAQLTTLGENDFYAMSSRSLMDSFLLDLMDFISLRRNNEFNRILYKTNANSSEFIWNFIQNI
jgi:hypothetical protein